MAFPFLQVVVYFQATVSWGLGIGDFSTPGESCLQAGRLLQPPGHLHFVEEGGGKECVQFEWDQPPSAWVKTSRIGAELRKPSFNSGSLRPSAMPCTTFSAALYWVAACLPLSCEA